MKVLRTILIVVSQAVTLPLQLLAVIIVGIYGLCVCKRYDVDWREVLEAFVEGFKEWIEIERCFINNGFNATVDYIASKQ